MMISTQDTAFLYLLHDGFPRIRSANQSAYIHFLKSRVEVVQRQHIWVGYFTTFPTALLRLHVLVKEFAVSISSLSVTCYCNFSMSEVIDFIVSLFIKGHESARFNYERVI